MDAEQFRKAGYQAIDRICDYHYSLRDRPVSSQVEPGYLRKALPSSAPTEGQDFQLIADDYQKYIIPGLTHWQHPSFFAYFPTSSTFEGILAELYASSTSNPGFNWSASPACTELEAVVMDWTAQILGLNKAFLNISEVGGGVIQTSASDSVLVATVAARSRYIREHPHVAMEDLVLYITTQTHSLGKKAGLVLGLKVRTLEVTAQDNFALRGDTLKVALEALPFPLAAWAGVAFVCPEYREAYQLPAINNYADSFCTNFHKWGLIHVDGSCLWVRHRRHLTDALDVTPEFLRSKHGDASTAIDYRNWQLGVGRRFRSLKFWFALRARGVNGFQRYITDCIRLNARFAQRIYESDLFSVVTKPSLAMTVFRIAPKSLAYLETSELNALNRAFHARLAARSDIAITQTDSNGVFCVRMVIGAEQTVESDIEQAFTLMKDEAMVLVKNWDGIGGRRGRKTGVVPSHSH